MKALCCRLPFTLLLMGGIPLPAQNQPAAERKLQAFAAAAKDHPLPEGGTLFIGSSSIELWEKRLPPPAAPPLIFRGIGGTTYDFLLRNADRLLADCAPARVIVYSGDNDIGEGKGGEAAADAVAARARELVEKIRAAHPTAEIYLLGIKPSIKRAAAGPMQIRANAGLKKISETMPGKVFYVDTHTCLLAKDGKPDPAFFAADGLHLNEKGYAIWNGLLAPILEQ